MGRSSTKERGWRIPRAGKRGCHILGEHLKIAFSFTNFCFDTTSDELAGKFPTPLSPGSALCQVLPLLFSTFLTIVIPTDLQTVPCRLLVPPGAAWTTHATGISHPLQSRRRFFRLSTFSSTWMSHRGLREDEEKPCSRIASRATLKGSA